MNLSLLEVKDLYVEYPLHKKSIQAVRGVHLTVEEGQAVGIVGESGSGKSSIAQAITGLGSGIVSGQILFKGKTKIQLGVDIGMVFQDPMSSLNPTMKIGNQVIEGLIFRKKTSKAAAWAKAIELLHWVGLSDPELRMNQYPHQLSGGQRQRVLLATALIQEPSLLIADEMTSALDKKTQEQILQLLQEMRKKFQMGLLLISHDFTVVSKSCDQLLVMYAGKIVERGPVEKVLKNPQHPYTQMLLQALPKPGQKSDTPLQTILGSAPNLMAPPKGCSFKERCPFAKAVCQDEPIGDVACWRVL